jgi:hypothetical protein
LNKYSVWTFLAGFLNLLALSFVIISLTSSNPQVIGTWFVSALALLLSADLVSARVEIEELKTALKEEKNDNRIS